MGSPSAETPPDTNYGPTYLIVIGVFTTFAVSLCSARIYSRIRPKVNIRFDDYLVATAMVCIRASCRKISMVNMTGRF